MVDRLIGVVCVTDGSRGAWASGSGAAPLGQQRRAQWTVTDRGSGFWCGQRLLPDPGYDWSGWVAAPVGSLDYPTSISCV